MLWIHVGSSYGAMCWGFLRNDIIQALIMDMIDNVICCIGYELQSSMS